ASPASTPPTSAAAVRAKRLRPGTVDAAGHRTLASAAAGQRLSQDGVTCPDAALRQRRQPPARARLTP
ncbi:hypothetical protein RZS08_03025, partial [Arthrospira platensis SPKY1]|nr:hypothetical protein [Arthrospira platensis SPKY1]